MDTSFCSKCPDFDVVKGCEEGEERKIGTCHGNHTPYLEIEHLLKNPKKQFVWGFGCWWWWFFVELLLLFVVVFSFFFFTIESQNDL